jgi:mRNA-degrading endonuclease toxin of MazEF toxin-antitoxin module
MKRGEIYLANVSFTDASGTKLRPVLIVSGENFLKGQDVVVLSISSKPLPGDEFSIYIMKSWQHFPATGLKEESAVKWARPMTLDKALLVSRLGRLHNSLLQTVTKKMVSAIS